MLGEHELAHEGSLGKPPGELKCLDGEPQIVTSGNCAVNAEPDWTEVYRASGYAYGAGGRWVSFALDGERREEVSGMVDSVTLITAWNPGSVELPLAANEAANGRLLRSLVAAGVPWTPAFGSSLPGSSPAWREEGYALHGLDRSQACLWGREWGQRAVVWLAPGSAELLFCAAEESVACRLRLLELADRVLPFAISA